MELTRKGAKIEELLGFANALREKGLLRGRSVTEISRNTGFSKKQTSANMKKLRELKLGAISASINYRRLPLITAQILVKTTHPSQNQQFFTKTLSIPFVEHVSQVSGGEITHVIAARTPSLEELNKLNAKIREEVNGNYIVDTTTTRVVYEYAWDEEFSYPAGVVEDKVKMDSTDWRLLGLLKADASTSLTELGEELKLRAPTVLRRIRLLEERGAINGYYSTRTWENIPAELQPISVFLFLRYKYANPATEPVVSLITNSKKMWPIEINFLYGEDDLSAVMRFKSVGSLQKFVDEELGQKNILSYVIHPILRSEATRRVFSDFADYYEANEKPKAVKATTMQGRTRLLR
ncbi:MAG: Lrp/AsnC family transcriptional regulator [Candidatus Micrarchaeota archaeon]